MNTILDYFTADDIRDAFGDGTLSEVFFKTYVADEVAPCGERRWHEPTVRGYIDVLTKHMIAARDLATKNRDRLATMWRPEKPACHPSLDACDVDARKQTEGPHK